MAIDALRVETEPRWRDRIESRMKLRNLGMTAVTEFRNALVREHVAIRRTMRAMTSRAAVNSRCSVFENERTAFVAVATRALLLPESTEKRETLARMRIMTGGTLEYAFGQAMALVEREIGCGPGVTVYAQSRASGEAEHVPRLHRQPQ